MSTSQVKEMVRSLFFSKAQRPYLAAMVVAAVLALYWDLHGPAVHSDAEIRTDSPESADTFIPEGFVLVPIEVQNFESLDSILGKFGVVDLYLPATRPGARPFRVATKIKIMRAPLNPSHFAVLVPETESAALVSAPTPFTVVVDRAAHEGEKVGTKIEQAEMARADGHDHLADESRRAQLNRLSRRTARNFSRITVEVPNEDDPESPRARD